MTLDVRASVCTFDCPDACSLSVVVDDGRIVKVRGSDALPYTAGIICNKVASDMSDFVHGPQRLLYPMRRIGPNGALLLASPPEHLRNGDTLTGRNGFPTTSRTRAASAVSPSSTLPPGSSHRPAVSGGDVRRHASTRPSRRIAAPTTRVLTGRP